MAPIWAEDEPEAIRHVAPPYGSRVCLTLAVFRPLLKCGTSDLREGLTGGGPAGDAYTGRVEGGRETLNAFYTGEIYISAAKQ